LIALWIFLFIVIVAVLIIFIRSRGKIKRSPLGESTLKSNKKNQKVHFDFSEVLSGVRKFVPKKIMPHIDNSLNYTNKSASSQSLDPSNHSCEDKTMVDLTSRKMKEAEATLVLKGKKHEASIISIAIKNLQELTDDTKDSLKQIISSSQGKGLVDWRADYIFLVFSPIITKTYHNEELACKVALKIQEKLLVHDKKFKDKIEFNIGVNSGDIVAMKELLNSNGEVGKRMNFLLQEINRER